MESWGIWKLIKVGFWLGIGFILPQLVVLYSGTALTVLAMPSMMEASVSGASDGLVSDISSEFNRAKQIQILEQREQKHGEQLLILGKIKNSGDNKASSIQLEAELLDSEGTFVYECSEYVSKELQPGETENYQIKCGCGKTPLPNYNSITVRVVSASGF